MTFVARGGEKLLDVEGRDKDVYEFTGVFKLGYDANDPDYGFTDDGVSEAKVKQEDAWIRYSPHLAVGIKVGTQSLAPTANAWAIGHKFAGDMDDDFIFYTAAALLTKHGISVDVNLAEGIQFGVGQFQGMGDGSQIASGGKNDESKTTVFWGYAHLDFLKFTVASQTIKAGGTETDADGFKSYEHKYKHNVNNLALVLNADLGEYQISPFFAYQELAGDKAGENTLTKTFTDVNNGVTKGNADFLAGGFKNTSLTPLSVTTESRSMKASLNTFGIMIKLGKFGTIVADQTKIDSPEWGEKDVVNPLVEVDTISHFNYIIEPTKDATITFFSNALQAKKDETLRAELQAMRDNEATLKELGSSSAATFGGAAAVFEAFRHTSTTSHGVQLQIKFGN